MIFFNFRIDKMICVHTRCNTGLLYHNSNKLIAIQITNYEGHLHAKLKIEHFVLYFQVKQNQMRAQHARSANLLMRRVYGFKIFLVEIVTRFISRGGNMVIYLFARTL